MEGGKWGLVIVAAAFLIQVIAFGVSSTAGVYNIEFLDYFDNDIVGVSLISAINLGVFLGSGPLCSFLMTKMSYRKIALIGSVMATLGVFLMPFLPYIPAFCLCFGVLTGLGSCLVYVPSHVLSGLYYERHQSLSTGIATSGSGLGGAIMPIITGNLIEHYGWKGSLIILAGLELHLIVFAALLRSPPPASKKNASDALTLLEMNALEKKADSVSSDLNMLSTGSHKETGRAALAVPEDTVDLIAMKESDQSGMKVDSMEVDVNSPFVAQDSEQAVELSADTMQTDHNQNSPYDEKTQALSVDHKKGDVKVLRHIYLFTDVGFDVYFISNILWNATAASVMSFGPELIAESGISALNSAWLLTISGLGVFIGGILGGVMGNVWVHHHMTQYILASICMGVSVFSIPFGSTFNEFAGIMICIGMPFGIVLGLLVVVLIDLIGTENLGDGMGYIMLANGLGAFSGPALTGYIRKVTGSFSISFYLAGALGIVSGVIMLLIIVIYRLFPQTNTSKSKSPVMEYIVETNA